MGKIIDLERHEYSDVTDHEMGKKVLGTFATAATALVISVPLALDSVRSTDIRACGVDPDGKIIAETYGSFTGIFASSVIRDASVYGRSRVINNSDPDGTDSCRINKLTVPMDDSLYSRKAAMEARAADIARRAIEAEKTTAQVYRIR